MITSPKTAQRLLRRRPQARRGGAVVELAICLPVLFTIIFGSIEASQLLHLQNALESAAHQGALAAIKHSAIEGDVADNVEDMLEARGINGGDTTLSGIGKPFSDVTRGEQFEIVVTAPTTSNLTGPSILSMSPTLEARINAIKQ